jgi:hypothetical protein
MQKGADLSPRPVAGEWPGYWLRILQDVIDDRFRHALRCPPETKRILAEERGFSSAVAALVMARAQTGRQKQTGGKR